MFIIFTWFLHNYNALRLKIIVYKAEEFLFFSLGRIYITLQAYKIGCFYALYVCVVFQLRVLGKLDGDIFCDNLCDCFYYEPFLQQSLKQL